MIRLRIVPFFAAMRILSGGIPAVCSDYLARMVFFPFGTLSPLLCSISMKKQEEKWEEGRLWLEVGGVYRATRYLRVEARWHGD
jgi:hypothetical protein